MLGSALPKFDFNHAQHRQAKPDAAVCVAAPGSPSPLRVSWPAQTSISALIKNEPDYKSTLPSRRRLTNSAAASISDRNSRNAGSLSVPCIALPKAFQSENMITSDQ